MIRIEPYDDKEKSVLTNLMNNEDFMSFIKSNLNNQHLNSYLYQVPLYWSCNCLNQKLKTSTL